MCLVTAGPGCTNLLSGVAEAYVYTDIYVAAVDWDGRDPIRRDGFVNR